MSCHSVALPRLAKEGCKYRIVGIVRSYKHLVFCRKFRLWKSQSETQVRTSGYTGLCFVIVRRRTFLNIIELKTIPYLQVRLAKSSMTLY